MSNTQLAVLAFVAFVVVAFLVKRKLAKKSDPTSLVNGKSGAGSKRDDSFDAGE
jgi:hypothetical protein